jgi:hypothetical protein
MATLTLGAPRTWQCRVSARDCPADHILTAGFPPPPRRVPAAPALAEARPAPEGAFEFLMRQLAQLRRQAQGVMRAIQQGRLQGRALEEALGTYQRIWAEVEQLEQEQPTNRESAPTEIHYDRAVVEDFVARLPEALRADVGLGREFLRETLRHVRIADADHRQRMCPICEQALGKLTPQHLAVHGVTLRDGYRRFPELGFTKGARLTIQPSPEGLLNTGEVFGMVVAGVGFEPTTFGL